nr:HVA22-like protein i [Tanacetum cinerariifolium]GEZ06763.1 HVA22-like protein i [Tanacetum cinerariifolium]
MFVVDTIRIIKEDSFRGTMQEDLLELGMLKHKNVLSQTTSEFRLLQAQDDADASQWCSIGCRQLQFLRGEQVTNFDDDVDEPLEQDLALSVDHVFESFVKPYLSKHEAEIDPTLMELKTRARDSATLYCSRVLVYGQTRAFEILQMVMA